MRTLNFSIVASVIILFISTALAWKGNQATDTIRYSLIGVEFVLSSWLMWVGSRLPKLLYVGLLEVGELNVGKLYERFLYADTMLFIATITSILTEQSPLILLLLVASALSFQKYLIWFVCGMEWVVEKTIDDMKKEGRKK